MKLFLSKMRLLNFSLPHDKCLRAASIRKIRAEGSDGIKAVPDTDTDEVMLVPLALIEKGTLLDTFSVSDSEGADVVTLSYNQTRGLFAYVIKTVVNIPHVESADLPEAEFDKIKARVAANLVTAVCAPGPKKKKGPAERERINRLLDSVNDLPIANEWKRRIRSFCDTFVDYYVIVAEVPVPAGSHIMLTYRQQVSVENSTLSLANRLRSRFGLRYSTFDIPLNIFALEVEAYHMQMDAGPMQYVFDHHLERMNSKVRLTQDDLWQGDDKPYVRLHYNSAAPTMHLYIRRQSENVASAQELKVPADSSTYRPGMSERLKSVVEFREIPPGALGAATVISLMTAIVISFFALTQIGQEPTTAHSSTIIGSDIPALVIALPGFAGLIIGSWLDLTHLRRSSLTTYMGLGACVTLSLASALYFLLDANKVVPGRIALHVSNNFVIKTDFGWLILATIAITCSLFLVRDVASSTRFYFNQVKERVNRRT